VSEQPQPGKVRIRLFGGFEVWCEDRQVAGFESQKVRALLAYLVSNRHRTCSRDHLAELLWPERDPSSARHALRQAVYDLRSKLPGGGSPASPVVSSAQEIRFNPDSDYWFDVEVFEETLRKGPNGRAPDPHHLVSAIQLYRGEFLSGFGIAGSESFEDWLVTEQERLREAAIEALRTLVESYRRRGEYRFGIHYARRLIAIDPLAEDAHRELMRLLALAGRRSQALAQYEELRGRLRRELGVEPLKETRTLHEIVLREGAKEAAAPEDSEPIGPLVPLIGRAEACAVLEECWQRTLEGARQLTLIEGEMGVGKTRLVKSFLDAAAARRPAAVLKGCCYELSPPESFHLFREALRGALGDEAVVERTLARLQPEVLEDLSRLIPELQLLGGLRSPSPLAGEAGRQRLFGSVAAFLAGMCEDERGMPRPLVLFLDDLHLADRDTMELLGFLVRRLEGVPIWILAVYRATELEAGHPLLELATDTATVWLGIGRLDTAALEEIAHSLVGEEQALELARFLDLHCGGLPLALTELINFLWDERILLAEAGRSWRLAQPLDGLEVAEAEDLAALTLRRIRRLPNSTRRLAALAAVVGYQFDIDLLQKAAEEDPGVVEIGLEILLKRWLVRQFVPHWATGRRERDIVLWTRGARRGLFEFAHEHIRNALYHDLNPLRRQAMHGHVASALEELANVQLAAEERATACEALAFHHRAAGQWERAVPYLRQAAERSLALAAKESALRYCDQAIEALSRLVAAARSDEQAERWSGERLAVRQLREAVEQS
jgi:DNA-binding SARP family transcriptional activator